MVYDASSISTMGILDMEMFFSTQIEKVHKKKLRNIGITYIWVGSSKYLGRFRHYVVVLSINEVSKGYNEIKYGWYKQSMNLRLNLSKKKNKTLINFENVDKRKWIENC